VELSPGAFWDEEPPRRDTPPPRAIKQEHFWQQEFNSDHEPGDTDLEDLYNASPRPKLRLTVEDDDNNDELIQDFRDLFSSFPSTEPDCGPEYTPSADETETASDFEFIRHPKLRPQTPLSPIADENSSNTAESFHESSSHNFLRRASDSPDPLALCLFPTYLSAFNELSLLSFLGHADPCEPFEPRNLQEAIDSGQWKQWEQAILEEYGSLVENGTWFAQDCPSNRQPLTGKWVFKIKRGAQGEILRYKARWVVRGFEQREGLDFHETFASVVKPMSYKAIFALAAAYDWEIEQMDVKTAFLYGDIDEDIWIDLPSGYGVSGTAKLKKALYGLKQSPRVWYNTLATFLASLDFKPLDADSSVFCRDGTIIAIYVDDLLIAGASKSAIDQIKASLSKRFKMTDLGACHFYLGMEVTRDRPRRTLRLSQAAYIQKVLQEHGFGACKPVTTPMETSSRLVPADQDYQADKAFRRKYQSIVGSLMYAMLGTRPDLAFAVSVISRFSSNPAKAHMKAVERILRYLHETVSMGLVFRGALQPLSGYTDSDWAADPDTRRSTSGYVFTLGSAAISWSSKRQPTVSLSTCEAEYIGQTNATKEAIWLQGFLRQIDPNDDPGLGATIIYGDNQGAIALAKNDQFHGRVKHIDIQHHFVREKLTEGRIDLRYVPTSEQVADGLTKPLCRDKFEAFRKAVGVE
jgi:hypothetical protein